MGTGVYQFFRKTGADLVGDYSEGRVAGEGVKDLVQGVVGGAFGSVAKITGAADDLLSKLGGVTSRPAHHWRRRRFQAPHQQQQQQCHSLRSAPDGAARHGHVPAPAVPTAPAAAPGSSGSSGGEGGARWALARAPEDAPQLPLPLQQAPSAEAGRRRPLGHSFFRAVMEAESGGGGGAFDPLPVLPYRPPPMHVGGASPRRRARLGREEGITGIVVRPVQGAREDGVPGFSSVSAAAPSVRWLRPSLPFLEQCPPFPR